MEGVIGEELGSSGQPKVHRQLFQDKQWVLRANRGMTHPTGILPFFPRCIFPLFCLLAVFVLVIIEFLSRIWLLWPLKKKWADKWERETGKKDICHLRNHFDCHFDCPHSAILKSIKRDIRLERELPPWRAHTNNMRDTIMPYRIMPMYDDVTERGGDNDAWPLRLTSCRHFLLCGIVFFLYYIYHFRCLSLPPDELPFWYYFHSQNNN